MPNYLNGKIYTIRNRNEISLIYVGSTVQSLAKRFGGHKIDSISDKCKNILLYKEVNNDWSNWYIELYELFPCNSKEELHKREGEIIRLIGNLNTNIAGRTIKEYKEDNKDKILEQKKEYREDNKEKLKKYYEDNKEKFKKYREDNKDKIKEKFNCECGGCYTFSNKTIHFKTKKHQEYLKGSVPKQNST